MRHMNYEFPDQQFAQVTDQFMVGHELLLAPLVEKGQTSPTLQLPSGTWLADDGKLVKGPRRVTVSVPLDRIHYFELVKP